MCGDQVSINFWPYSVFFFLLSVLLPSQSELCLTLRRCHSQSAQWPLLSQTHKSLLVLLIYPETPARPVQPVKVVQILWQVCSSLWWWVDCHHVEISFLSYRKALLKLKSSVVRRDWCASWKRAIKFYASIEQKKWTSTTKTWKPPKGPEWSNTRRSRREIRGLKEDEIKGRAMVKKRCPLCLDCPCV